MSCLCTFLSLEATTVTCVTVSLEFLIGSLLASLVLGQSNQGNYFGGRSFVPQLISVAYLNEFIHGSDNRNFSCLKPK